VANRAALSIELAAEFPADIGLDELEDAVIGKDLLDEGVVAAVLPGLDTPLDTSL